MSGLLGALLGVALPVAGALAGGGSMSPGAAYLVGENGPEIRRGNTISSNAESKRMLSASAGSTHYYAKPRAINLHCFSLPALNAARKRTPAIATPAGLTFYFIPAIRTANSNALMKLTDVASPFPAMSNAVP